MRVFVYESLTAGPLDAACTSLPEPSLLREGLAMLSALVADLAAADRFDVAAVVGEHAVELIPASIRGQVRVIAPTECAETFDRLAAETDATVVIAPEIGGELATLCRRVQHVGGKLVAPTAETIELLSDKHRTAEHLRACGVSSPNGMLLPPGILAADALEAVRYPAVLKPLDGAGSLGVQLVRSAQEIKASDVPRRLESHVRGKPASVAALCGPGHTVILPACTQRLSDDGCFSYLGGDAPLSSELTGRAQALAKSALASLHGLAGYIGVDLVLGDDPGGGEDTVIEINPRLTTSYVGLRCLVETNLAAAMLDIAMNKAPGPLSFRRGQLEFDAEGTTRYST